MTIERAKELLNYMIDRESVNRNNKELIQHLLYIGFTSEELRNEFNFSATDIADAKTDINEYEED